MKISCTGTNEKTNIKNLNENHTKSRNFEVIYE